MIPCESAAFRRMPAFFIAAARSGPCEIARASSSAACASASKSSTGRLCVAMAKKLRRSKSRCLSGSRLSGSEGGFSTWNQEGIKSREVIWAHITNQPRVGGRTDAQNFQSLSWSAYSTVGSAMQRPSDTQISPLRRQAADALRRARKLPVGHARNDLRQLASGLLWLDKRNLQATVQDRVTSILALTDFRS
jgi:hypothetical protein